jgi:phenylalanyl-tRNA synthetase beta chain
MKLAKIRGEESFGMICAEDEIGLSDDHGGIIVLDSSATVGTPASDIYSYYQDWIYEIGLTPNRMDAMSHYGVAKDVCAYITYHEQKVAPKNIYDQSLQVDASIAPYQVSIEDAKGCARYAGVVIEGVAVKPSPEWLQQKLQSIGLRSINNIVDITNFILHETGQPLHAFDADQIVDKKVVVKTYPKDTTFVTLDGTERKLASTDLMISDAQKPLCIAGVYGGLHSGVTDQTKNIFLESAWFDNVYVRKTSVHHGLRTDAATRFEKGVDIANTANVLQRAAIMIQSIAGGKCSVVVDQYPSVKKKAEVTLTFAYLKKLSGKNYATEKIVALLEALHFEVLQKTEEAIVLAVPYNKPDISLPADIVEEIVRIDGLDNIEIPSAITMSPSIDPLEEKEKFKDKIANYLVGKGFVEILTNSITNSKYFSEEVLRSAVKMLNNLSADLDVMRPSMLETGLEAIAYNINRRNHLISFFEIGKVYSKNENGKYKESEQLAIYLSGNTMEDGWRQKGQLQDFFVAKGLAKALMQLLGLQTAQMQIEGNTIQITADKKMLGYIEVVSAKKLQQFDIKQSVMYLQFDIPALLSKYQANKVVYKEISKFPSVERDLALVVPAATTYDAIESCIYAVKLNALKDTRVFDVFESEKLGDQKKSVAINFVFNAEDKTLTDTEIDSMMKKLIQQFEKQVQAEIRK